MRRGVQSLRVFVIATGESLRLCFCSRRTLTRRPRQLEKAPLQLRQPGGQQLSEFTRDFVQSTFPYWLQLINHEQQAFEHIRQRILTREYDRKHDLGRHDWHDTRVALLVRHTEQPGK